LIIALPPIARNHTPPRLNAPISQPAKQVGFGALLKGGYNYVSSMKGVNDAKKVMEAFVDEIVKRGEKAVKDLTDVQILDIWSHRMYENLEKFQQQYVIKFNDICENHVIKLSKDEKLLTRTIPLVPDIDYSNPFSIGKPDTVLGNCPAAAMRGGFDEDGIKKGVLDRAIKDKKLQIEAAIEEGKSIVTDGHTPKSMLYVIEPLKTCEVSGFDWRETGNVEMNGFGSSVFQAKEHLDENKC